jgi:hypothetical protein
MTAVHSTAMRSSEMHNTKSACAGGPGWPRFNANGGLELYAPRVRELAEAATKRVAQVGNDVRCSPVQLFLLCVFCC